MRSTYLGSKLCCSNVFVVPPLPVLLLLLVAAEVLELLDLKLVAPGGDLGTGGVLGNTRPT